MRGAFVDQGGLFSYIAPEARVHSSERVAQEVECWPHARDHSI